MMFSSPNYFFTFTHLEHDLWGHEGFLAHDDHVTVRKADAGLGVGGVLVVEGVGGRHGAVLLLIKSLVEE